MSTLDANSLLLNSWMLLSSVAGQSDLILANVGFNLELKAYNVSSCAALSLQNLAKRQDNACHQVHFVLGDHGGR